MQALTYGLRSGFLGLFVVVCGLAIANAGSAQVKLRSGYVVVPVAMAPLIDKLDGVIRHKGKSYTPDHIHFRGSSQQLTALAAGELEIAQLAFSSFAGGIVNARQDIVALADIARDGPAHSNIYAVLDKSGIKSVKDLKGKILAVNAKGGAVDMAARVVLLKNGLKPGMDVTIVEARFGAMEAMLRQGKVDIAIFAAPFWAKANGKGGVRPLFRQRDGIGTSQFLFYAAKREFVRKNRAALVDWLEDYIRGTRWLLDPANRDKALDMTAAFTKRKRRIYQSWAFTKDKDLYHDPSARLDVKALQRNIDTMHEQGILRRSFDVTKHVDESLVKEAAARIK
jgi:NitT/TauT family transport system substrate-binding protein